MKIIYYFLIFILLSPISSVFSEESIGFVDMCPALPEKIESERPKFNDYVSASIKLDNEELLKQYENYSSAQNEFEAKYSKELREVALKWKHLEEKNYPSQSRFYQLRANNSEDRDLLNEIKSVCWGEVMGKSEFKKDGFCNPLESPPTSKNWNGILLCTVEQVKILNIKLL